MFTSAAAAWCPDGGRDNEDQLNLMRSRHLQLYLVSNYDNPSLGQSCLWPATSIRHPARTVTVGVQGITIQPALSTFPFQFPFHQVNVKASPPPAPAPPTSTLKCLFIQDDVDIVPDTRPPSPNICTHKTHNSVFPGLIMS